MLLVIATTYLFKTCDGCSILTWLITTMAALVGWRFFFRRVLYLAKSHDFNTRSAAIYGVNGISRQLAEQFFYNRRHGIRFLGYYDDRCSSRSEKMSS